MCWGSVGTFSLDHWVSWVSSLLVMRSTRRRWAVSRMVPLGWLRCSLSSLMVALESLGAGLILFLS